MINLPQPPTDNLYKFTAILGLVLGAGSVAYGVAYRDWEFRRWEAPTVLLNALNDSLSGIIAANQRGTDTPEQHQHRLDGAESALKSAMFSWDIAREEIDRRRVLWYGSIAGSALGIGLAGLGFALWYRRLQRYEDALVRARADDVAEPEKPYKKPGRKRKQ